MASPLITPDSSVLIAASVPEHQFNRQAAAVLPAIRDTGRLIGHTMAETLSVLTRQANPHPPMGVLRYLDQFLEHEPLGLAPGAYPNVLRRLAENQIVGGAVYDGLIAATAAEAGLRLLSLDRRAVRTYAAIGADYEILV